LTGKWLTNEITDFDWIKIGDHRCDLSDYPLYETGWGANNYKTINCNIGDNLAGDYSINVRTKSGYGHADFLPHSRFYTIEGTEY